MSTYDKPTVTLLGRIHSLAPGAPQDDQTLVSVETESGWALRVISRADSPRFDATITNPFGSVPCEYHFQRSAEDAIEKACNFVRFNLSQPHVATALRTMAAAELRL